MCHLLRRTISRRHQSDGENVRNLEEIAQHGRELAEREGFAPLPVVANKELNRLLLLTIRLIRTKAPVESRIEHVEPYT